MAEAVNLGRSVFYEKVKSLVGMSPIDFLRRLRMQRAEQLIARSSMNVSEIAYAVGYTDPKYFSRCFKKETGLTPREYREKKAQSTT
jgi:AraC-like DNA-binding protein